VGQAGGGGGEAVAAGVVGELVAEQAAGAVEAAHHGAEGTADLVGGVAVGEAVEVDQFDDLAVVGREGVEGAEDLVGEGLLVPGLLGVVGLVEAAGVEQVIEEVAAGGGHVDHALVAVARDEGVDEDPRQPGAEVAADLEAVPVGPALGQRLLDQILGLARLVGQADADAQQAGQVRRDLGQEVVAGRRGGHAELVSKAGADEKMALVSRG
jgi:hypothetical protein